MTSPSVLRVVLTELGGVVGISVDSYFPFHYTELHRYGIPKSICKCSAFKVFPGCNEQYCSITTNRFASTVFIALFTLNYRVHENNEKRKFMTQPIITSVIQNACTVKDKTSRSRILSFIIMPIINIGNF